MDQKLLTALYSILNDQELAKRYISNPQQCLAELGLTPEEQNTLIPLLSPLQELRKTQLTMAQTMLHKQQEEMMKQQMKTQAVNDSFHAGITQANDQTISGFHATMTMYKVSFYLGVVLIIAALVFAIVEHSMLFSIIFGSIGTLDLLTFFIAKPPQSLQQSRSDQAKLNAVFYSWFLDLYNWNSFYLQYSSKGKDVDLQTMKDVSNAQISNTERLMQLISEHIGPKD